MSQNIEYLRWPPTSLKQDIVGFKFQLIIAFYSSTLQANSKSQFAITYFPTCILPVPPVLIKVNLNLERRVPQPRSPGSIKETSVILIIIIDSVDHLPSLPVLVHVDRLQSVAGGQVVPAEQNFVFFAAQASVSDIDFLALVD